MMSLTQYIVIFYILFWPIRFNGCLRRWRQPLLRGREWFFNVHVQSGFYEGAGKKILRGYFLRMFVPFAVDIPLATTIFLSGHLLLLQWLVVGLALLIHANHYFSVSLLPADVRSVCRRHSSGHDHIPLRPSSAAAVAGGGPGAPDSRQSLLLCISGGEAGAPVCSPGGGTAGGRRGSSPENTATARLHQSQAASSDGTGNLTRPWLAGPLLLCRA